MIRISLNNELLDVSADTLVTYKKSQQLNGIQDLYSYSNNFTILNSSKNRRLLGISYLPNSKAKAMTAGYDVDVVLSNCIYLKKQKLKVQKEPKDNIPVYLIFTDSFLIAKAKEVLMNQIETDADYTKSLANFVSRNFAFTPDARTAPISAQDKSGLVVVEEVPILLNLKTLVLKVFTALGYSYTGDILTDVNIGKYYISSNVGVYGPDGVPRFADTYTCYDFLLDFLETFNGYIEPSDSARSVGLYFWKNIESIKDNFVDYSDKFTGFTEYTFDGGLAKLNNMKYSDSPEFYNGFFKNNKSIVDKSDYLNSDFGAGNLRLFADQEPEEDGTIALRVNGEDTEPQTLNIFRFEETFTTVPVYAGGIVQYLGMYKAFSPNILEIYQLFHQAYTDNISLPTIGLINFRYDAIFLADFKMAQVFFIKQLSTYWLPLEQNFTSKKDGIKIKALMIEKTSIDSPVVFDISISVDYFGETVINDLFLLYSALNDSPADTMIITDADLSKNDIYVNGVQILALPASVSTAGVFEFKAANAETANIISSSPVYFQFVAQNGGISRIGKITVNHNGRANYDSEFRSTIDEPFGSERIGTPSYNLWMNHTPKITTFNNIPVTLSPDIGETATSADAYNAFKAVQFSKSGQVRVTLSIESLKVYANNQSAGPIAATTIIYFDVWKNGAFLVRLYSAGVTDVGTVDGTRNTYLNINEESTFNVNAADVVAIMVKVVGNAGAFFATMASGTELLNMKWNFYKSEQI